MNKPNQPDPRQPRPREEEFDQQAPGRDKNPPPEQKNPKDPRTPTDPKEPSEDIDNESQRKPI